MAQCLKQQNRETLYWIKNSDPDEAESIVRTQRKETRARQKRKEDERKERARRKANKAKINGKK